MYIVPWSLEISFHQLWLPCQPHHIAPGLKQNKYNKLKKKMVFENSVPTTMYLVIINVHVHVANEGCEEFDILKDYSNS